MTTAELAQTIAHKTEQECGNEIMKKVSVSPLSVEQVRVALFYLCETVTEELKKEKGSVRIDGLGSFETRTREQKNCINPLTHEKLEYKKTYFAHAVFEPEVRKRVNTENEMGTNSFPHFKQSQTLKKTINLDHIA